MIVARRTFNNRAANVSERPTAERWRIGRSLTVAARIAFLILLPSYASAQTPKPAATGADGQLLYSSFCIICHGPMGQGGPLGPAIISPTVGAMGDRDIARRITEGNLQAGMPAFGRGLERSEIDALVGYIRVLQKRVADNRARKTAVNPIPEGGNVANGEQLFRGKASCSQCHSVFYAGGMIGPDLSHVAERLSSGEIYEAVATPSKKVAREFGLKKLTTKDGKTIQGRFRNETNDSIQILDASGTLWTTYFRKDFASLESPKESPMPEKLLEKLSPEEAKDLFAYLNDLK